MPGWLRGLVAVTCLAVLAAVSWWGWSEWRSASERAEAARLEEEGRPLRGMLESASRFNECADMVRSWDDGDRGAIEARYGSGAEEAVDRCWETVEREGARLFPDREFRRPRDR